jgi:hypothetical protein
MRVVLGLLAVSFYAAHGLYHYSRGFPENLLWACHMGALLVGLGLLLRSPALNAVGVLWLALGTPLWLAGRLGGGVLVVTSMLTHLGGLSLGLWGLRRTGVPRHVAWWALGGIALLHLLSRWLSPLDKNVNLAREVWPGFEAVFPSHALFVVVVAVALALVFVGLERGLRAIFGNPSEGL